jgi:uncharacterized SAM-binding protein YcdF (DUF218 family)
VSRRPRPSLRLWLFWGVALCVLGVSLLVLFLYLTVPRGTAGPGPVEALLVLGTPADLHGNLTEMQRWRVDEGVREYRRHVAPRLIFSGGPTSHGFTEADVMAAYAERLGVPAADILRERHAFTTVQNIAYSAALLRAHGWRSAEVISTREHLPRAAVLLEKSGLRWRTHITPTPDRGWADTAVAFAEEAVGTAVLRIFGLRAEPVLHQLARGQHGLAYAVRFVLFRLQDHLRGLHR